MGENQLIGKKTVFLLMAAIFIGALWIRVYHLGSSSFWNDEMYHVNAAKSIMENGRPVLEGGRVYKRALPFTYIVLGFVKWFGMNEAAARWPAVIFGVLTVLAVFFVVKRWFNVNSGVLASLLVAFSPLCIEMSRECRMYTMFQFFYLGLVYFAYETLEGNFNNKPLGRVRVAGLAFFFLVFSYLTHSLTLFFGPTIMAYFLVMTFAVSSKEKGKRFIYLSAFVLLSLFAFAIWQSVPGLRESILEQAAQAPPPAMKHNRIFFYKWLLEDWYPVLFYAYPIAILYMCRKDFKKGAYIALVFLVPMILKSTVFQRKAPRYILAELTFFYIVVSVLLAGVLSWIWKVLANWNSWMGMTKARPSLKLSFVPILILIISPLIYGAAVDSLHTVTHTDHPAWKAVLRRFEPRMKPDEWVVTDSPMELKHYGVHNTLFNMSNYRLDTVYHRENAIGLKLVEPNTGVFFITNLDELLSVVKANGGKSGWFFHVGTLFQDPNAIPLDIQNFLIQNAQMYKPDGTKTDFASLNDKEKKNIFIFHLGKDVSGSDSAVEKPGRS